MRLNLTQNDHFRYGYGANFALNPSPENRWNVAYGKSSVGFGTFGEECVRTARLIRDAVPGELWLLLSGGIDSEIMVRSFHRAGLEFKTAIMQFADNLNIHDICYAVKLCDQLNIPYKLVPLDLKKFWGSREFWNYADRTASTSPQFISAMWLAENLPGYSVFGSGEPYYVRAKVNLTAKWLKDFTEFRGDDSESGWDLWEKEKVAALFRFFQIEEKSGCPAFFQYTPEIIDAFTHDPAMRRFFSTAPKEIITTFHAKQALFSQYFPLEPRTKYTGFEKVMDLDKTLRLEMKERYPGRNAVYRTHIPYTSQTLPLGIAHWLKRIRPLRGLQETRY